MDNRFLYRLHKWLAVIVGLATLGWFASGVIMAFPEGRLSLSPDVSTGPQAEARLPGAPEFDAARVTPADAITAVRARIGKPFRVTSVALRRLPGRLVFQISADNEGSRLVDAITGTIVDVDATLAQQVVARFLGSDAGIGPATPQDARTLGYSGPVPSYRVPVDDSRGTVFYVDRATASAQITDNLTRPASLIQKLHGLGFLRSMLPVPLWVAIVPLAGVGVVMSLTGLVILLVQLQRWFRRTRGSMA